MKKRFGCLIVASVLMGGMNASSAQPVEAKGLQLEGYVCDATGARIPGADVVVRAKGQQITEVKTDSSGEFRFQGAAGMYDLTVASGPGATLVVSIDPKMSGMRGDENYSRPPDMPTESRLLSSSIAMQRVPNVSPVGAVANSSPWEFGALAQGGVGLQDRSDFKFLMVGGHAGKVLTSEWGSGLLRGNLEYAVEVFPLWQSYTPTFQRILCPAGATSAAQCSAPYTVGGTFTGASVTPIILRWNFTNGSKLMPWVQGAGGVVYTTDKYPAVGNTNFADPTQTSAAANTSVWNFTPQFGLGAHYFVRSRRSVDVGLNVVHISSASLGDKNPGVNSSLQFSVGYSWWK